MLSLLTFTVLDVWVFCLIDHVEMSRGWEMQLAWCCRSISYTLALVEQLRFNCTCVLPFSWLCTQNSAKALGRFSVWALIALRLSILPHGKFTSRSITIYMDIEYLWLKQQDSRNNNVHDMQFSDNNCSSVGYRASNVSGWEKYD